jgi:hypothetical protein
MYSSRYHGARHFCTLGVQDVKIRTRLKITLYVGFLLHAPTEEKSEKEKDQLYGRQERTYKQCPSYDTKIISGDMNARVEKKIWTGIAVGTCGLRDETNYNGTD